LFLYVYYIYFTIFVYTALRVENVTFDFIL